MDKPIVESAPAERMFSRRDFMRYSTLLAAGTLAGCAVNPVTGKNQLMLMNASQEIAVDRKNAPHQLSQDYGTVRDAALNRYVERTGRAMVSRTHRPEMPYSFRPVAANYVNAYAFPGGSIAVTRGILLKLESEAELAALLGHELGHVNARHTAEQMSKGMVTQLLVAGAVGAVGAKMPGYRQIAEKLGMMGAGALLASYSRDNERQADDLGMQYMVKSGYSPEGMVGLMGLLKEMSRHRAAPADLLFATHPMGDERYRTAVQSARTTYGASRGLPLHRERYMDNIAGLRKIRGAVERQQKGEEAMGKKRYREAEALFRQSLLTVPEDYTGLLLMTKCLMMQDRAGDALKYAEKARAVNGSEAQAHHLVGMINLRRKRFDRAYAGFSEYDRLLPGNPNTTFFKGYSLEGLGRRQGAAENYSRYLKAVNEGDKAKHAYGRLVQWGYIRR